MGHYQRSLVLLDDQQQLAELDATVRRLVPEYHVEPHPAERAEGDPSTAAAS